jgi:replication fork protection complex subunit Tof1/Swi1
MFKDNKLRLLMKLVGFERLGEHHDPDAAWIVPSSLTSAQLQESIDLIRKFEFDPPTYEDGKTPEDLLRSKAATARRSTRRADFDDDSDNGIDNELEEDHGEYAQGGPTTREGSAPQKKLKRRRRQRTPDELDDEEKDRRAAARRQKEIEKQAKALSTMFVHDSDDEEWDAEKDAAFFAREEAIRQENLQVFKKSLVLGTIEPVASKKRKADAPAKKSKRRKSPPKRRTLFADSDDEGEEHTSSRAASEAAGDILDNDDDDDDDTPLSPQNAAATIVDEMDEDDTPERTSSAAEKGGDVAMTNVDMDLDDDDDDDDDGPVAARRPAARNTRAGFVVDSDSE